MGYYILSKRNLVPQIWQGNQKENIPYKNGCGYFWISASRSKVASSGLWYFQSTLMSGIIFFRSTYSFRLRISITSFAKVKFSSNTIGSYDMMWEGSGSYFWSMETWKYETCCEHWPAEEGEQVGTLLGRFYPIFQKFWHTSDSTYLAFWTS